jgi:ribosome maturation factor RimP
MGIGFDPKKEYVDMVLKAAKTCGFSIYEQSIRLKGENTRIVVKIDSPAGITHSNCEAYSRELSRLLDEHGGLPNYALEVSSPGTGRSLYTPEDYIRFTGSLVKIVYDDNGSKCIKGKIIAADTGTTTVYITEEKRETVIPYDKIKRTNIDN